MLSPILAKMIHDTGRQKKSVFLAVNCQTFPENLLESELFGHVKGAFTGATESRTGRFEAADGGTLLLDEIGDLTPAIQAKLLRVIETKTINRIGAGEDIHVDFRLISATNADLETAIEERRFREDLYYRISTIILNVPPLRERAEDLPQLIEFFKKKTEESLGIPPIHIDDSVMRYLSEYNYPGNIRELKNIMERMIILADGDRIDGRMLEYFPSPAPLDISTPVIGGGQGTKSVESLRDMRKRIESAYIRKVLNEYRDPDKVARVLGISRRHLTNKIAEYKIRLHDIE
jgi:transcriptional regulator with PAS, ATPase and Fis domain